jgi:hypothetical protein
MKQGYLMKRGLCCESANVSWSSAAVFQVMLAEVFVDDPSP